MILSPKLVAPSRDVLWIETSIGAYLEVRRASVASGHRLTHAVAVEVQDLNRWFAQESGAGPKIARFALACIAGATPLVGGVFGAAGGAWSEAEQD
jgi:hypothetical protein